MRLWIGVLSFLLYAWCSMGAVRVVRPAVHDEWAASPAGGPTDRAGYSPEYRTVRVSSYCNCKICCGPRASGVTASGRSAIGTRGVATDPSVIPTGSRLDIPNYGNWTLADDTGSAIKGDRIDLRVQTHEEAKAYGVRYVRVRIWRKQ